MNKSRYWLSTKIMFNFQCSAPLHSSIPLNLSLLGVILFIRDGVRTPDHSWAPKDKRGSWYCDNENSTFPQMQSFDKGITRRYHWKLDPKYAQLNISCKKGQLTNEGMKQLEKLGELYRNVLIDDRSFLPEYYDRKLFEIKSSNKDRAVGSLISFFHGFYPPDSPNEIVDFTTAPNHDLLNPDRNSCQDLKNAYHTFSNSEPFKARKQYSQELQDEFYKYLNLGKDNDNWQYLGDWITSLGCSENADLLPDLLTDEMIVQAMNDSSYYLNDFYSLYPQESSASSLRLIMPAIENVLSLDSTEKMFIYSGLDTTLGSLLAFLGHPHIGTIIPAGSHLMIEIYDDPSEGPLLRFVFNGDILDINGNATIRYSKFKYMSIESMNKCK